MRQIILTGTVFLCLSGCASFPSFSPPAIDEEISEQTLKSSNMAAVLLSITADMEAGGEQAVGSVFYESIGDESGEGGRFKQHGGPLFQTRHFEDENGKLLVELLKPGIYALTRWTLNNSTGTVFSPRYPLEQLKFEVAAGQVVYIGNIHFDLATGKNHLGLWNVTGGAWARYQNKSERDLALAKQMFPNVEEIEIVELDGYKWELHRVMKRGKSSP